MNKGSALSRHEGEPPPWLPFSDFTDSWSGAYPAHRLPGMTILFEVLVLIKILENLFYEHFD